MSYKAYVTYVKNIRPAENADRLNACEVFGNTTIIDKTITEDTLILYLPSDGQISVEFGEKNNLFRRKDENGNNVGGFVDPDKRNIAAIRLRGNRSDGLVLPISCLNYCFSHGDASIEFHAGDVIDGLVNGHEIARKYIPKTNHKNHVSGAHNKVKKKKVVIAPLFKEHKDTEQLAYNLNDFKEGDQIEITLKMHGTSGRTAYLPCLKGYKRTWKDKLLGREGTPVYEYDYVSGTRRVVLERYDAGFYGSDAFRKIHAEKFKGKLHKGETVYYEIVGFTDAGVPIMSTADNRKLNDKEFIKKYGKETVFSYGCDPDGCKDGELMKFATNAAGDKLMSFTQLPQSDIYVYRMTMTNEDGDVVEYSPEFMRYRCEQMGVKTVPVMWQGFIPVIENDEALPEEHAETPGSFIKNIAEKYYDGADPIGKTHIREGVVVRIVNRPTFTAYKHKNFNFKVLENIIKVNADAPDMEEAQEIVE